jgi:uncharacterized repeat protein (TIGR01451 family)
MRRCDSHVVKVVLWLFVVFFAGSVEAGDGGYVMRSSLDVGGPAPDWIDISASGTLVTGLADDNSAPGTIALPQTFRYFGADYNAIKIGSNGWVAFTNVSNIASCFPTIPQAGGPADGYTAPYMADLNFTGAGNPGTVRTYHDAANDRFVVSYLNVPYWAVAAPGYTGSTTFQLVLEFASGTVRFNYQSLTALPLNASCNDLTVGVEGLGGDGLEYAHDADLPSPPLSIVFLAPGGIDVTPTSGLITNESGSTAAFDVVLATQPSSDVTIAVATSDSTEGTVSPSSLTFTSANWDVPQSVTITGADDAIVDGSVAYSILLGAAVSSAPNYNGIDPADVAVTNSDDDIATLIVSDVTLAENTGSNPQATFNVTLDRAVTGGFSVAFSTADGTASAPSDYTSAAGTLNFTGTGGEVQTVQVTVIADSSAEIDESFVVNLGTPSNAAVGVGDGPGVATIVDDDAADVSLTLADAPDPVDAGSAITYTAVVSNAGPQPATGVTITMPLPPDTSFVSGSVSGGGACTGSPIVCTVSGSIASGDSRTATIVLDVAPSAIDGTTITATANAASAADPNAANDSASATTTVGVAADLVLAFGTAASQTPAGVPVAFNATSQNSGPSDAPDLTITITLDPDLLYSSHTPSSGANCTTPAAGSSGAITCAWPGATPPGTTRTLQVFAYSDVPGSHGADATTFSGVTDPTTNSSTASITVAAPAAAAAVPTLDPWMLALLTLCSSAIAVRILRRV